MTTGHQRSICTLGLLAVALVSALAVCAFVATAPARAASPDPVVQILDVPYTAWNGSQLTAALVLPLDYSPDGGEALPCVIQPHGRGSRPRRAAALWGDLPTRLRFAVICPDAAGVRGDSNSWGAPGQIDDIVAMPATMEQAVPGLRVDRDRLYLVGSSMGGQEALLALSRAPDRFAAAAVFDGPADLAARYRDMGLAGHLGDQTKLRRELGGAPTQRRFAYAQRSPLAVAPTLALCGVPLCVGWSTADEVVTRSAETQFGRLCRRLRALSPSLPLHEVVTALPHGYAIKDTAAIAAFLAPGGVWRTRGAEAPERSAYRGWQTRVDVWDRTIEAPGATGSGWWQVEVAGDTVTVESSAYLRVAIRWPNGEAPVTVEMNGRERRVWPRDGLLRLSFLAGSSTAIIRRR